MIRRLRRLVRTLRGPPLSVWFHASYRLPVATANLVPGMSPRRAEDALTWAVDQGVVRVQDIHEAREVRWGEAALAHDQAYLEHLDEPGAVAAILGMDPEMVSAPNLLETWRRGVGATVDAARWARRYRGRAVNLFGGFHHAAVARGAGFCALNDVAIAIRALRAEGFRGDAVVVDMDAHPPDGIVDILRDDRDVTVISVSVASEWSLPTHTSATVLDLRVPVGADGPTWLEAVDRAVAAIRGADLAFYLAGADPLQGDPLGTLAVSEDDLRQRDRRVLRALRGIPTVILAAGGYTDASWRVLAGTLAEAAGFPIPVAPGYDPVFRRMLDVSRLLDQDTLSGSEPLVTESELLESLGVPVRSANRRFLGFYTRHGLEYALTAYGYLPALQRLGFQGLKVEVEGGNGPDRMRITADVHGEPETLVDLSVTVRPMERWRLLYVEWLELRDPRVSFTTTRPQLPGQRQPGLGLAEETGQLLVRAAERLGLDGVAFAPAHYHVAWIASGRFVAVDPVQRGRMRALRHYLSGVPLRHASQLLDGPGIPTIDGDEVRWEPTDMVAAVDADLLAWLQTHPAEADAAEEALLKRLVPRSAALPP